MRQSDHSVFELLPSASAASLRVRGQGWLLPERVVGWTASLLAFASALSFIVGLVI